MIEVEWKCYCVTVPQKMNIRARGEEESIEDFMEFLKNMLGYAHTQLSPICQSTIMEYVKIPVKDGKGVGE